MSRNLPKHDLIESTLAVFTWSSNTPPLRHMLMSDENNQAMKRTIIQSTKAVKRSFTEYVAWKVSSGLETAS